MNEQDLTSNNSLQNEPGKDTTNNKLNPQFDYSFISPKEEIENHINDLISSSRGTNEDSSLFTIMPAQKWIEQAKSRPIPRMLFDEFWFEGELCFLFADTNLGKSILAVQIGNSISKGISIPGLRLEAEKQPIIYFDFELSDKQFENRYSEDFKNHYEFSENFFRVELNPDSTVPDSKNFEEFLAESMEKAIIETGAKILIIDNITYLKNETEKAKDALPLMKHLKALKKKYDLSILALAHTPKRDLSKPITRNDLQGSKMLMSFTDSSFTIGESQKDKSTRYLKQIKVRQNEFVFDAENVWICSIEKNCNFLQFVFLNFGTEKEHLKERTDRDKTNLIQMAKELNKQGKSQRFISSELQISLGCVNKYLKL